MKGVYVLFITAKSDAGFCTCTPILRRLRGFFLPKVWVIPVLDPRNEVCCVKSVAAVPLQEARARPTLEAMANRYNRTSIVIEPLPTNADDVDPDDVGLTSSTASNVEEEPNQNSHPTKVKFSDTDDIKLVSPRPGHTFDTRSASPVPSTASSTSSNVSAPSSDSEEPLPITKVIASRLSFWSGLPSQRRTQSATLAERSQLLDIEPELADDVSPENIRNLQDAASSPPASLKQRHNEMDAKILKECIKEFTKGGMYFAYNFGELSSKSLTNIAFSLTKLLPRHHYLSPAQTYRNS